MHSTSNEVKAQKSNHSLIYPDLVPTRKLEHSKQYTPPAVFPTYKEIAQTRK